MKKILKQIGWVVCFCTGLSIFPAYCTDVFVMTNIPIAAEGKSAVEARQKAVENGESQAFVELLDKIVASNDRHKVQIAGHDVIAPFVLDVSVANEGASSTRYSGALTVRFKGQPVRTFLESQQVSFLSRLPQPALVLPKYKEGSQIKVLDDSNPLWLAMQENMPASRLFQLTVPMGVDDEDKTAYAAVVDGNERAFHTLAQKYNVTQVMIIEVVKQDTDYTVTTRVWPKNSSPEAEIKLNLTDDRDSLPRICKDLLSDALREMSKKWLYLSQNSTQPVQLYPVIAPIEKISDYSRVRQKLQQISFADKVDIKGFSNKQLAVDFHYRGTINELGEKLRMNDLILTVSVDENGQPEYRLTEPDTLNKENTELNAGQ